MFRMLDDRQVEHFRRFAQDPSKWPSPKNPLGGFDSMAALGAAMFGSPQGAFNQSLSDVERAERRAYAEGKRDGDDIEGRRGKARRAWSDLDEVLGELDPQMREKLTDLIRQVMATNKEDLEEYESELEERSRSNGGRTQTRDELPKSAIEQPRSEGMAGDRASHAQRLAKKFPGIERIGIDSGPVSFGRR